MIDFRKLLLSLTTVTLLAACGSRQLSVPAEQAFPPHFAMLRDRILRPRCGACHPKVLQYNALRSELVVPGQPGASHLFTVIDSGQMPQYGGKLPDEEISAIKTWISDGAQND